MFYQISDNHGERLPFIRFRRIEINNFKGVKHGVVEFNGVKEFVPYNTKSDILGIYGQNGSGKSSLVEAIYLVKSLAMGIPLNIDANRYIDVDSDSADISVEFDFQYKDGTISSVEYSVKLSRREREKGENIGFLDMPMRNKNDVGYVFSVSDEIIKTNMYPDGTIGRKHPIVDTKNKLFCGDDNIKYYFDQTPSKVKEELIYLKRKCSENSKSFIFCDSDLISLDKESYSRYHEILAELALFLGRYVFVISTKISGLVQLRAGLPVYVPDKHFPLLFSEDMDYSKKTYESIVNNFIKINKVIETLIPDFRIELSEKETIMEDGEEGYYIKLLSVRGDKKFPLEYESDGLLKLVSFIADYIVAFNQGSTTMVVDEFDAAIFEYLLGELLTVFEENGKGQFIFTSHNLRPLEVINKKYIRFTTADPNNRYYKMKNVGNTNNLRDTYLREVRLGGQEVEMYRATKTHKMVKALMDAGKEYRQNGEE